jgi:hypothetical protein
MEAKLFKREDDFYSLKVDGIVMATSNGMLVDHKLSLKNCEVIERGYDLDELVKQENGISQSECSTIDEQYKFYEGYLFGFQKALSILGDKKFSEDDVNLAFVLGKNKDESRIGKLINSRLQQTEWDVIVETTCDGLVTGLCIPEVCDCNIIPKLDEKGQLILKIK